MFGIFVKRDGEYKCATFDVSYENVVKLAKRIRPEVLFVVKRYYGGELWLNLYKDSL